MIFISSNEKKIEEFRSLFGNELEIMQMEYPELKADTTCEVAMQAAKALAEKLQREVVVEDSGLFIDALNGFPGTNTKFSDRRIGNAGLLKLMENIEARGCEYQSAVGYCRQGEAPRCFLGVERGKVAESLRGDKGWGQDALFIPEGATQTYGEKRKPGDINAFRKRAAEKLKAYLAGKKEG